MAEDIAKARQYEYGANSNLVLQADRSLLPRRDKEPTGEPESLYGRIDPSEFGAKVLREKPSIGVIAAVEGAPRLPAGVGSKKRLERGGPRKKPSVHATRVAKSFLDTENAFEGLRYRPRSKETRAIYELMLSFLSSQFLSDQPQDVARGATDEVLSILKNDELRDAEKRVNIESILMLAAGEKMSMEQFTQLVNLSKKVTDYAMGEEDEAHSMLDVEEGAEGVYKSMADQEYGVTVVFDDDDNAEDEGLDSRSRYLMAGDDDEESDDQSDGEDNHNENDNDGRESGGGRDGYNDADENGDYSAERGSKEGDRDGAWREQSRHVETDAVRRSDYRPIEDGTKGMIRTGFEKVLPKYHVDVRDIDAFWLQRQISSHYKDPLVSHSLAQSVWHVLESVSDPRELENQLVALLEYDKFDLVKMAVLHRKKILYGTRLAKSAGAPAAEREQLMREMSQDAEGIEILRVLESPAISQMKEEALRWDPTAVHPESSHARGLDGAGELCEMDLEAMAFQQGAHTMTNKRCKLPDLSWKKTHPGYEEIHIPAPRARPMTADERLVQVAELPAWAAPAFSGSTKSLNRLQSAVSNAALGSDENLLVCAPTGAGKTNVALMAILRILAQFGLSEMDSTSMADVTTQAPSPLADAIRRDAFKVVYIAPMKALVQEMVASFGKKLAPYGIAVAELSGDRSLSKAQIAATQMIVTTPEKWDVITRKTTDRSYTRLVRLLIMDEIHLLHDERGPVLEALVARTLRQMEQYQDPIRLVGLSATLPNYDDVAAFLRVRPESGLFYFDASYRPCPLAQSYFGFTEKKALKRHQLMNELVYEKVAERAGRSQVLIFVHSRKETSKTAKAIRDLSIAKETIGRFLAQGSASHEILQTEAATAINLELQELLPYGFAIHHAGLSRADRSLVEELFAEGHLAVLVSTATLAWGVNLPAHTVLIKGTQVYSPEKGTWTELSPQDILQMFGRAGRPQYDTEGEGLLLTSHAELQYYLSLMNQQLPIESQLVSKLVDHLNAEVVLGSVRNRGEAVEWLGYTYLYVRMLRDPATYGLGDTEASDPLLKEKRLSLVHSAALTLERSGLVVYDKRTGSFEPTELGRIASHYYISHASIATYNSHMKSTLGEIDVFRLFSLSSEFRLIPVREEEKLELAKLIDQVPIPVKEGIDEPAAKINVLLQAYISGLPLDGFALTADMVYVTQSASRLLRALFEMSLRKGWARLSERLLDLAKMVERRAWLSMSPLRQFRALTLTGPSSGSGHAGGAIAVSSILTHEIIKRFERKDLPFDRLLDLSPAELGELVRFPKSGKGLHRLLHHFPRLELAVHVQPLSRSLLQIRLTLTPDFVWDTGIHGVGESFWIFVKDVDEERLFVAEPVMIKEKHVTPKPGSDLAQSMTVELHVPILDPLPPAYFIDVVSDRWLHCSTSLPLSFRSLILPEKNAPLTSVLDLAPVPLEPASLGVVETTKSCHTWDRLRQALWPGIVELNAVQTQAFRAVYEDVENVWIGAGPRTGKTLIAELALLSYWRQVPRSQGWGKAIYMAPYETLVKGMLSRWTLAFSSFNPSQLFEPDREEAARGCIRVGELSGDVSLDLKLVEACDLIVGTPRAFESLTRRWRTRRAVQQIGLAILDDLHLIGSGPGPELEVVVSRLRAMFAQLSEDRAKTSGYAGLRFVGLGLPVAQSRELAEWLGAPLGTSVFNFSPNVRASHVQSTLVATNMSHVPSLLQAIQLPIYRMLKRGASVEPTIIFVSSRRQATLLAADLMTFSSADGDLRLFSDVEGREQELRARLSLFSSDTAVAAEESASFGIAFFDVGSMSDQERQASLSLFMDQLVSVLIATLPSVWALASARASAPRIIMAGTVLYDGLEGHFGEAPLPMLMSALGRATRETIVYLSNSRREYYKKVLHEPLSIESQLDMGLAGPFVAEISVKNMRSKQDAVDWLTWTFMYRRLSANPNYYHLSGSSHRALSDGLSEMVESTLTLLAASKMITIRDESADADADEHAGIRDEPIDELAPLNLAMIAAYYNVSYETMDMLSLSLKATTKLKGVLELIASASEFEALVPLRKGEGSLLARLEGRLPQRPSLRPGSTAYKVHLLLQSHFSRFPLSPELQSDQRVALALTVPLLHALVDISAAHGWLAPALSAMDCCQMIIQGVWDRDSPLKQLPCISAEQVAAWSRQAESLYDLIEEDTAATYRQPAWLQREASLSPEAKDKITTVLAHYPNIDLAYSLDGLESDERGPVVLSGDTVTVNVRLERHVSSTSERTVDDRWAPPLVNASLFPRPKEEGWWLLIAEPSSKTLLSIKKCPVHLGWTLERQSSKAFLSMKLELVVPTVSADSDMALKLYLMSDAWLGCDQEYEFGLCVQPAQEEDQADEMEEE